MIKAVVFDLDGTLINSLEDLAQSMNAALVENGLPIHPIEKYKLMIGDGVTTLAKRAAGSENAAVYEPVLARMREIYKRNATNNTATYKGIAQVVKQLKSDGIKLAVLTNKLESFALSLVDYFFEKDTFDFVKGATLASNVKPDPAGMLELLKQLDVKPGETILVGDSGVDMQVADAVGAFGVGAAWGFRPREELEKYRAKAIIDDPEQLLAVVGQASRQYP